MTIIISSPSLDLPISFPIISEEIISLRDQELEIAEWVEIQDIITIEDWDITHGRVFITPMFPELISFDAVAQLQQSFYDYLME
jgi:hypothetical protein